MGNKERLRVYIIKINNLICIIYQCTFVIDIYINKIIKYFDVLSDRSLCGRLLSVVLFYTKVQIRLT